MESLLKSFCSFVQTEIRPCLLSLSCRFYEHPCSSIQKIQNLAIAFSFMTDVEGIELSNTGRYTSIKYWANWNLCISL